MLHSFALCVVPSFRTKSYVLRCVIAAGCARRDIGDNYRRWTILIYEYPHLWVFIFIYSYVWCVPHTIAVPVARDESTALRAVLRARFARPQATPAAVFVVGASVGTKEPAGRGRYGKSPHQNGRFGGVDGFYFGAGSLALTRTFGAVKVAQELAQKRPESILSDFLMKQMQTPSIAKNHC